MTKQIAIPISGLKVGEYDYHFEIEHEFFDEYVNGSDFKVKMFTDIKLEKSESLINVFFKIQGSIELSCARCNDLIQEPLMIEENHIFKFGITEMNFEDDGLSVIPFDSYELDLSKLIYEYVILSIPVRPIHEKGKCNDKSIQVLENILVKKNEQTEIDPRWSVLKEINK